MVRLDAGWRWGADTSLFMSCIMIVGIVSQACEVHRTSTVRADMRPSRWGRDGS